jgi:hypothetical protein
MDNIYRQAVSMLNKLGTYIDEPNNQAAKQLKSEVQRLTDEIEVKKNPRSLEDRVKNILNLTDKAQAAGIIDHHHADDLEDTCRDLQQQLRKLM